MSENLWIGSRALWDAVERIDGGGFGVGDKLRPWLQGGSLRVRAKVIVRNDLDPTARPGEDIPRSILSKIADDQLFVGSDRLLMGSMFEAVGLSFPVSEVEVALGFEAGTLLTKPTPIATDGSGFSKLSSTAGRRQDIPRWERFMAAMALIASKGDLNIASVAAAHDQVAKFLSSRGDNEPLGIETVRQSILRFQTWAKGHPASDDHPESGPIQLN